MISGSVCLLGRWMLRAGGRNLGRLVMILVGRTCLISRCCGLSRLLRIVLNRWVCRLSLDLSAVYLVVLKISGKGLSSYGWVGCLGRSFLHAMLLLVSSCLMAWCWARRLTALNWPIVCVSMLEFRCMRLLDMSLLALWVTLWGSEVPGLLSSLVQRLMIVFSFLMCRVATCVFVCLFWRDVAGVGCGVLVRG